MPFGWNKSLYAKNTVKLWGEVGFFVAVAHSALKHGTERAAWDLLRALFGAGWSQLGSFTCRDWKRLKNGIPSPRSVGRLQHSFALFPFICSVKYTNRAGDTK